MGLKEEIKEKAKSFGFDLCGVSDLFQIELSQVHRKVFRLARK